MQECVTVCLVYSSGAELERFRTEPLNKHTTESVLVSLIYLQAYSE